MKQSNTALRAAITVAVVLAATIASADPVRILQDSRVTSTSARVHDTVQRDFAAASDTLTSAAIVTMGKASAVASASVTSSFANPLHWFAVGSVDALTSAQGELGAYTSTATFAATFEVTEPVAYAFDGRFQASSFISQPPSGSGDATWLVSLARQTGGGPLPSLFQEQGQAAAVRSFIGTLTPDQYVMVVTARTDGHIQAAGTRSADAGFNLTFDLRPLDAAKTPEPASMLLLGTGLAGMFGYGCRARRRQ